MTRRPALRTGLVAVITTVAAFLIIGGYLGVQAHRYHQGQDRATAVATGLVVKDGIGGDGDIRVRWTDAGGRSHEQRFGIYDTDRYRKGAQFDVRYNPAHPSDRAYPADPDETSGEDNLTVPMGLAGLGAAGLLVTWAWRGLAFRLRSRSEGTPVEAVGLRGEHLGGLVSGASCWLKLGDQAYQRVMWHPAFDAFREGPVLVRGDVGRRHRVVIELPSGDLLVPIGRLRHKEPRRILLEPTRDAAIDRDELWVFPPGTPVPPARRWWRRPLAFGCVGALVGAGMSVLFGSVTGIPALAAGMAGVLVNSWALTGTEP